MRLKQPARMFIHAERRLNANGRAPKHQAQMSPPAFPCRGIIDFQPRDCRPHEEQLAPWPLRLQLQQHVQRPTHAQDMEYVMWVYDSVREGRFISAIIS